MTKALPATAKSLARAHTMEMIQVLVGLARASPLDNVRLGAANSLIDRGWGHPDQHLEETNELRIVIRQIVDVVEAPMKTIEHEPSED